MVEIFPFSPSDYDEVTALWLATEGLTLVAPTHRRQGLGRSLADRVLEGLGTLGIVKCHLFIRREHAEAREFWERSGWTVRDDVTLMSHSDSAATNA